MKRNDRISMGSKTQYVQYGDVTDMKTALWRVLLASKSNKQLMDMLIELEIKDMPISNQPWTIWMRRIRNQEISVATFIGR